MQVPCPSEPVKLRREGVPNFPPVLPLSLTISRADWHRPLWIECQRQNQKAKKGRAPQNTKKASLRTPLVRPKKNDTTDNVTQLN